MVLNLDGAGSISVARYVQGTAPTDTGVAGFVGNPESQTSRAVSELVADNLLWSDRFADVADGALAGRTPILGAGTWSGTGATPPTISAGAMVAATLGYAYANVPDAKTLACEIEFSGDTFDPTLLPMTMAWVTGTSWSLTNLTNHFNFGPRGYSVTIKRGATFYPLMTGQWATPMRAGRRYHVAMSVVGDRLVLFANGEVHVSPPDARVRTLLGPFVFWEPTVTSGIAAKIHSTSAWAAEDRELPTDSAGTGDLLGAGATLGRRRQAVGNPFELGQTQIGYVADTHAGVTFGATTITAATSSSSAIGATTISLDQRVPSGTSIVLDPGGANEETVVTSGFPIDTGGLPPYVTTLTAPKTKAHAADTVAVGTVTGSYRTTMYLHQGNGFFYLPDLPVLVAPGGKLYLGSSLTQFIESGANSTIQFPVPLRPYSVTTTQRNALTLNSSNTGAMVWDSTLKKAAFYDHNGGSPVWRDALGTAL